MRRKLLYLPSDLAQSGGLQGFALLETGLINLELIFQRLDQRFDALFPQGQVSFG